MLLLSSLFQFGAISEKETSESYLWHAADAKCAEGSLGRTGDGIEWSLLVDLLLPEVEAESRLAIKCASKMVFTILGTVLDEAENDCVHPLIHTFLAFLQSTASIPGGLDLLEDDVPWSKITGFLNRYLPEGVNGYSYHYSEDSEMAS